MAIFVDQYKASQNFTIFTNMQGNYYFSLCLEFNTCCRPLKRGNIGHNRDNKMIYKYTRPTSIRPPMSRQPRLSPCFHGKRISILSFYLSHSPTAVSAIPPRVIQFKTLTKSFNSPPTIRHARTPAFSARANNRSIKPLSR